MKTKWYSMTALYHWMQCGNALPKFERRITICSAVDLVAATKILLRTAQEYASDEHIVFLGEYDVQEVDDSPSEEPTEVAYEMTIGVDIKTGQLIDPEQFIEQHWTAGKLDSCDRLGFNHAWHNIDNLTSGCYNCQIEREGQLWTDESEIEAEPGSQE